MKTIFVLNSQNGTWAIAKKKFLYYYRELDIDYVKQDIESLYHQSKLISDKDLNILYPVMTLLSNDKKEKYTLFKNCKLFSVGTLYTINLLESQSGEYYIDIENIDKTLVEWSDLITANYLRKLEKQLKKTRG